MKPHPVDIHVGKRLRLRRTMLGISQDTLGNSTGITFQQIQKYERGINRIGSSRLYEFSKILGVPISYFFEEFGKTDKNDIIYNAPGIAEGAQDNFEYESLTSRETLEMVRAFYRIKDKTVRKRLADLIKSFADAQGAE